MGESLDRLVGRAVLSETDRIVGGNPDDLVTSESGETNGAGSVRDEVLVAMVRGPPNT